MDTPKRMKFGSFLGPFHRVGENPTLAMDRDLELIDWMDSLGFDEVWVGEHHSSTYENIAMPEIFLDRRPGVKPSERFKAFTLIEGRGGTRVIAWVSGDGFRFAKLRDKPIIHTTLYGAFDGFDLFRAFREITIDQRLHRLRRDSFPSFAGANIASQRKGFQVHEMAIVQQIGLQSPDKGKDDFIGIADDQRAVRRQPQGLQLAQNIVV